MPSVSLEISGTIKQWERVSCDMTAKAAVALFPAMLSVSCSKIYKGACLARSEQSIVLTFVSSLV